MPNIFAFISIIIYSVNIAANYASLFMLELYISYFGIKIWIIQWTDGVMIQLKLTIAILISKCTADKFEGCILTYTNFAISKLYIESGVYFLIKGHEFM